MFLASFQYRPGLRMFTPEMLRDCCGFGESGQILNGHNVTLAFGNSLSVKKKGMEGVSGLQDCMESVFRCRAGWVYFHGSLTNFCELCERYQVMAGTGEQTAASLSWRLFEKKGSEFATEFRGVFVVAVYDETRERIVAVRDHFGQHGLYYGLQASGAAVIGDDINSMVRLPGVSAQVSAKAVSDYLSLGYIPAPLTIYRSIRKVPSGGYLELRHNSAVPVCQRYWRADFSVKRRRTSFDDSVREAWTLLDNAVNRCLSVSPGAGVLLSGGIDSNVIMALCTTAAQPTDRSFTVGFGDATYDERRLASLASSFLKIRNDSRQVEPCDCAQLETLQTLNGEPFADSSLIPTTMAMRLAAEHGMTCVLTGAGGDELFGGYRRYRVMAARQAWRWLLPPFARRALGGAVLKMTPSAAHSRTRLATIRRLASFIGAEPLEGYASFQQVTGSGLHGALLRDEFVRSQSSYLDEWASSVNNGTSEDFTEDFNELDIQYYLPYDGCVKERLAASAAGIGHLCPLLDVDVAEFGISLPRRQRMTMFEGKRVLRGLARQLLPKELLKPSKRGFGMPVASWFRGPLREELRSLAADVMRWDSYGWLNPGCVERLATEHLSGQADHSACLWALLCLRKWLEGSKGL